MTHKLFLKSFLTILLTTTLGVSPLMAEDKDKAAQQPQPQAVKTTDADPVQGKTEEAQKDNQPATEKKAAVTPKKDWPVYVGDNEVITSKFEDTLLELGRKYNLGYVEIVAANPGVDPWIPGEGTKITLPKRHIIPDVPREGIVINLAEMRMYDFTADPAHPKTYPIGIGREGLNTPTGITHIMRKTAGPTWRPTDRMRREKPELPAAVPPGADNPLGTHALYLGWSQYLIHGTNKPLGIGRRASSGCIRMYPEDIIKVFKDIPVGTQVRVIKEPIKLAWIDGMLYMEAHAEDQLADSFEDIGTIQEYRVPETLFADLQKMAGDHKDKLDWQKIRAEVKQRSGLPVAILTGGRGSAEDLAKDPETSEIPAATVQPAVYKSYN